jgi:hypothetical protein
MAQGSDIMGKGGVAMEGAGLAFAGASFLADNPRGMGLGFSLAAAGGLVTILAGGLQGSAGFYQGIGGGGYDNLTSAALTVGLGAGMGRLIGADHMQQYSWRQDTGIVSPSSCKGYRQKLRIYPGCAAPTKPESKPAQRLPRPHRSSPH